jgi:hypothetical protein
MLLPARPVAACPFCAAVGLTLGDEIEAADVAVIAHLHTDGAPNPDDPDDLKSEFTIDRVLKGAEVLGERRSLRTLYSARKPPGTKFLVLGSGDPELTWVSPNALTPRGWTYLSTMLELPKSGPQRLLVALPYLEDEEEMLRRDAYDEFARAPYPVVKELGPQLKPDELLARIKDPKVSAQHVRLYCTLLGTCGQPQHAQALESIMRSKKPQIVPSLDAMVAAYLRLTGADGLAVVEELFLRSEAADDAPKVNAVINALRFHGQEKDIIPQARIVDVMRTMLARPQLAARVLADLARWANKPEDWRDIDRAAELFEQGKGDTMWVREPAAGYLVACPLPQAQAHLARLEKIDPAAVHRARNPGLPQESTVYLGGGPVKVSKKNSTGPAAANGAGNAGATRGTAPERRRSEVPLGWTFGALGIALLLLVVVVTAGALRMRTRTAQPGASREGSV